MTPLDCADLRRRAEHATHFSDPELEIEYLGRNVVPDELLALLDLAKRLEAALRETRNRLAAHVPYGEIRRKIHDEMMDCADDALAAAKEAKL